MNERGFPVHLYPEHGCSSAFDHAVIGMAIFSLDGTLLKANRALCDLFACGEMELASKSSNNGIYRKHIDEIVQHIQILMSHDTNQIRLQQHYSSPTGDDIPIDVTLSILKNDHAVPHSILAQYQERSDLKQLHSLLLASGERLEKSEASFQQLLEDLPLSVLITREGVVQYVNRTGLRMIGADTLEKVLGMNTSSIVDRSYHKHLTDRRRRYRDKEKIGNVIYLINCLDGEQKFVDGFSLHINYKEERAVVGVFRDITDQKRDEERLMQSEKLSIAGQLAAGIAHEIRNPLTSINGFIKLISSSQRHEPRYFEIIDSELKRIELIVNELLILSKPQATHELKPTEIVSMLKQVVTLMSVQAAMKNVEIEFNDQCPPIWIYSEANQLKQVFINLLKNAMEAMPKGGSVQVIAEPDGDMILIQVQDEGCGMPPEMLNKIGQPFFSTKESGTGLGLMITYNIIHNHGGSIAVHSLPDVGTTFTVKLPILSEEELSLL
ncbi:ATP-binding protein [Paenibacillus marinisediminis]